MATTEPILEADETVQGPVGREDNDSNSTSSTTGSIASTVLKYEYENGRRYHAYRSGNYVMPNDEAEQDRLDLTHHLFAMFLGGESYRAPVKDPKRVLDVGTGTGIWPIEVADQHPQAEIIATDLSPIQPKWAPTNLSFQVDDIETEWTFGKPFDFIHIRILGGSIADWPKLIANAHANLTPGGYLEVVEWETWSFTDDGSLPEDSKFDHWQKELNKAASSFGREMRIATKVKGWVEEAGFEDVNQEVWKIPVSPWAKDPKLKKAGAIMQEIFSQSLEAYSLALFTRVLGYTPEEVEILIGQVREEAQNRKHHIYGKVFRVWGMKPGKLEWCHGN